MTRPECATCLAWAYTGTKFGRRDPPLMFGWCRVHGEERERFQACQFWTSKAEQERQYLASVKQREDRERSDDQL